MCIRDRPYTLAGLLVAVFGAGLNLQFLLQQPAAILTSVVIFVLLALSMLGSMSFSYRSGCVTGSTTPGPTAAAGWAAPF